MVSAATAVAVMATITSQSIARRSFVWGHEGRERRVRIVDALVLADLAAQLLRDRPRPRLERRIGELLRRLDGERGAGQQQGHRCKSRARAHDPASRASSGMMLRSITCGVSSP